MDSSHRKIELQSPADLAFLTTQLRTAALHKLDLHLPPVTSSTAEPDELRRQVEDLVDAFVAQILDGMKRNISINGIDVVATQGSEDDAADVNMGNNDQAEQILEIEKEEFEPFDDKLRAQLASTIQKRDALIAKISQHRRTTPSVAAQRFEEAFAGEMEGVERLRRDGEKEASLARQGDQVVGVEALKRADEVQRNWDRALEGLARLQSGLPETRARLERAGEVVGYLGGRK